MPITQVDPQCALVVIDLQRGTLEPIPAHKQDEVVGRSATLADAFREQNLPVVLVNVAGRPPGRTEQKSAAVGEVPDGWTALVPELRPQPSDLRITKHTRGAFTHTDLEERLRRLGTTQVFVTGVSTSVGVESTVREAHERGFHVVVVSDALLDSDGDAHAHSLEQVFPKIAEVGTTDELLLLLAESQNQTSTGTRACIQ